MPLVASTMSKPMKMNELIYSIVSTRQALRSIDLFDTDQCYNNHPVIRLHTSHYSGSGIETGTDEASRYRREDNADYQALRTARREVNVAGIAPEDGIAKLEQVHLRRMLWT